MPDPAPIHSAAPLVEFAAESFPARSLRWTIDPADGSVRLWAGRVLLLAMDVDTEASLAAALAAVKRAAHDAAMRTAEKRLAELPAKVAGRKSPLYAH